MHDAGDLEPDPMEQTISGNEKLSFSEPGLAATPKPVFQGAGKCFRIHARFLGTMPSSIRYLANIIFQFIQFLVKKKRMNIVTYCFHLIK